jgi:hypothetical protein
MSAAPNDRGEEVHIFIMFKIIIFIVTILIFIEFAFD